MWFIDCLLYINPAILLCSQRQWTVIEFVTYTYSHSTTFQVFWIKFLNLYFFLSKMLTNYHCKNVFLLWLRWSFYITKYSFQFSYTYRHVFFFIFLCMFCEVFFMNANARNKKSISNKYRKPKYIQVLFMCIHYSFLCIVFD